jgi:hypothetical protein
MSACKWCGVTLLMASGAEDTKHDNCYFCDPQRVRDKALEDAAAKCRDLADRVGGGRDEWDDLEQERFAAYERCEAWIRALKGAP